MASPQLTNTQSKASKKPKAVRTQTGQQSNPATDSAQSRAEVIPRKKKEHPLEDGGSSKPGQTSTPELQGSKKKKVRVQKESTEKKKRHLSLNAKLDPQQLQAQFEAEWRQAAPSDRPRTAAAPIPQGLPSAPSAKASALPPLPPPRSPSLQLAAEIGASPTTTQTMTSSRSRASTALASLRPQPQPRSLLPASGSHLLKRPERAAGATRRAPNNPHQHLKKAGSPLASPRAEQLVEEAAPGETAAHSKDQRADSSPHRLPAQGFAKPVGGHALPGMSSLRPALRKTGSARLEAPAEWHPDSPGASSAAAATSATPSFLTLRVDYQRMASVKLMGKVASQSRAEPAGDKAAAASEFNGKRLRSLLAAHGKQLEQFGIQASLLKLCSQESVPDGLHLDSAELLATLHQALEKLPQTERDRFRKQADKVTMQEDPFGPEGLHLQLFIGLVGDLCQASTEPSPRGSTINTGNSSAIDTATISDQGSAASLLKYLRTLLGVYRDKLQELKIFDPLNHFAGMLEKLKRPSDTQSNAIREVVQRLSLARRDELIPILATVVEDGSFSDFPELIDLLQDLAISSAEAQATYYQDLAAGLKLNRRPKGE